MDQAKNIYIDTQELSGEQLTVVDAALRSLCKGSSVEGLRCRSNLWAIDCDGAMDSFSNIAMIEDDHFMCDATQLSYEELIDLAKKRLSDHNTTTEVKDSVDKLRQIDKPDYYQLLPEYQVSDINKALLDKIEQSDFDMTFNEAGWFQQAMQYLMRFYGKNGIDDLEKGVYALNTVIQSLKERENV